MKLKSLAISIILALCLTHSVWAISLDEAKARGLAGEQLNGYLGVVTSSPSAELIQLINSINSQRKDIYQRSAADTGVELQVFEIRTGQRLQAKAQAGEYIQDSQGQWRKK